MNKYTRKIDREYQRLLTKNAKTFTDENNDLQVTIEPYNIQEANDYLVMAMFDLDEDVLDSMSMEDYTTKLEAAKKGKE